MTSGAAVRTERGSIDPQRPGIPVPPEIQPATPGSEVFHPASKELPILSGLNRTDDSITGHRLFGKAS